MTVTMLPPASERPGPRRAGKGLDRAPKAGTRKPHDGPTARPGLREAPPRPARGGQARSAGGGPGVTPASTRSRRRPAGARWEIVPSPSRTVGPLNLGRSPAQPLAASPGPGRRRERTHPPRLTFRGRVVVCVVLAALVLAAFSLGRASGAAAHSSGGTSSLVVQPGQTLWEIAGLVAPEADRRSTVATLVGLNSGLGTELRPGQSLRVP